MPLKKRVFIEAKHRLLYSYIVACSSIVICLFVFDKEGDRDSRLVRHETKRSGSQCARHARRARRSIWLYIGAA